MRRANSEVGFALPNVTVIGPTENNVLPHWHIIWTVHGVRLPQAANTSWSPLAALYASLADQGLSPVQCDAIVDRTKGPSGSPRIVEFTSENASTIREAILDLGSPQGDRVAGDLGLEVVLVGRTHVELLLQHPSEGLHQKLSRLKSRSATLLSFRTHETFGGKGTWGNGFWVAQHERPEAADAIRRDLNERLREGSDPSARAAP